MALTADVLLCVYLHVGLIRQLYTSVSAASMEDESLALTAASLPDPRPVVQPSDTATQQKCEVDPPF